MQRLEEKTKAKSDGLGQLGSSSARSVGHLPLLRDVNSSIAWVYPALLLRRGETDDNDGKQILSNFWWPTAAVLRAAGKLANS